MKETVSFLLLQRILDLVKDSGANGQEASCALKAAVALLPELELPIKPMMTIQT